MRDTRKKQILLLDDISTIKKALNLAGEQYAKHEEEFLDIASYIRAGNEYDFFAPGEAGAKAAEKMAEDFKSQAEDCEKLEALLEDSGEVVVYGDEED